jgi:hypothetical protein
MGSRLSPDPDLRRIAALITMADFCCERRELHHTRGALSD